MQAEGRGGVERPECRREELEWEWECEWEWARGWECERSGEVKPKVEASASEGR
jgi:hypothetical protein